jgi:LAS superfamily LD-carboxypeptidase LdcB
MKIAFDRLSYDDRLEYCLRPEETKLEDENTWLEINNHLGTSASNIQDLMRQLGIKRFGYVPTVGDCFAGGGSIPFEAARIGLKSYASDLNPLAGLLTWSGLNILSLPEDEIKKLKDFQEKVFDEVCKQVEEWGIEKNEKGWMAKYYLYCNETACPHCKTMVPMAPTWWISKKSKTIAPQTKNSKVSDEEDLPIPDEDLPIPDETSSKTYSNLPFDFLSTDEKDPGPRLNIFGSKYDKLLKGFASAFSSFGGIGKLKNPTTSSDVQPEKKITTKTTTTNTKKDDTKDLPQEIKSAISKLEKNYNLDITDEHIQKELEQEGGYREDAGGENSQARMQINKMINDARKKFPKLGKLGIVSGYRSYNDQVANFGNKAKTRGIDDTQRANTIPGFSQHHTGKAFDIFSVETSWWNKNSDVRDWVAKNASKYGFDVTYKKQGPLRIAEPWHLYYVGGEVNEQNFIKNKILKEEIERIKQLIKTT